MCFWSAKLSETGFFPRATCTKCNEIDVYELSCLDRLYSYCTVQFVAVNRFWCVIVFIALDLVLIDAAAGLSFFEVRVECIDKTLTSIRSVAFIHEVA